MSSSGPTFSIITACRGRLDHLRQTLPAMVKQADAEVIVVDFSCPQDTAAHVAHGFPGVRVVKVEGKDYFSNWEARNAGAAAARGEWLLFCDADIILDPNCTAGLRQALSPLDLGKFRGGHDLVRHRPKGSGLGANSLQGFQVIERSVFQRIGGYDTRLRGYGAGGDTELYQRAVSLGLRVVFLDEAIVEGVIEHGDELRHGHTREFWFSSYLRGFYYGRLKMAFTKLRNRPPSDELCDRFIAAADDATRQVLASRGSVDITFPVDKQVVPLTDIAGYPDATVETILTVKISFKKG